MTPQQRAALGEIAVQVGTAQELLQRANQIAYGPDMLDALPWNVRAAIGNALIRANDAAAELLPFVQTKEATNE